MVWDVGVRREVARWGTHTVGLVLQASVLVNFLVEHLHLQRIQQGPLADGPQLPLSHCCSHGLLLHCCGPEDARVLGAKPAAAARVALLAVMLIEAKRSS